MLQKVKELLVEVSSYSPKNAEELEQFRIQYLGKKGLMNDLFAAFKEVPSSNLS
jgi:phenylalanyl-tRNA synthetase alpha chain